MLKLILIAPLILAGAAQAQAMKVILPAGGRLAAGAGSSVAQGPDGRSVASDGKRTVTCPAGKIALAAAGVVHITTRDGVKTYPHGFIGCLDPARFGGAAAASFDQGVSLKPADGE